MKELKKMVEKLEEKSDPKEQIKILQDIGTKLINEYRIEINGMNIEPLLVEAYYYHEGKFEDTSIHAVKDSKANTYKLARKRQKNNFGKLYVHYGTKDGIDIVLSLNDNYYLSFLIKTARINGKCAKQCAISQIICGQCENVSSCKGCKCKYYEKEILKPLADYERKNLGTVFLPRKGIKNDFATEPLAIMSLGIRSDKSAADAVVQSLEKGYKKQWLYSVCALSEEKNEEIAREKANKYNKSSVEDKYWNLAKTSLVYKKI